MNVPLFNYTMFLQGWIEHSQIEALMLIASAPDNHA